MQISLSEAADRLDELMDRVEAGEEVVLTVDGRAVARMVAATPLPPLDDIWSLARTGNAPFDAED